MFYYDNFSDQNRGLSHYDKTNLGRQLSIKEPLCFNMGGVVAANGRATCSFLVECAAYLKNDVFTYLGGSVLVVF